MLLSDGPDLRYIARLDPDQVGGEDDFVDFRDPEITGFTRPPDTSSWLLQFADRLWGPRVDPAYSRSR